jgi:predicted ribosome quality control (RQC) complex YloA/Tae2 family protein
MEIRIDFTKSAQDNANDYYNKAKKLSSKKDGAEKAIKDLEKTLGKLEKEEKTEVKERVVKIREKKWYEKFHWFFASDGNLVMGGRDAQQNELINSRHFDEKDLFFHANIFGASATVLKNGVSCEKGIREQAAQFAACYSSAWKEMLGNIDVYAMHRNQVSKSTSKGSIGTGSFLLSGEREWFRNMPLALVMFVDNDALNTVPEVAFDEIKVNKTVKGIRIVQGKDKKSDAAKNISKYLDYKDLDTIIQQLPAGTFLAKGI